MGPVRLAKNVRLMNERSDLNPEWRMNGDEQPARRVPGTSVVKKPI